MSARDYELVIVLSPEATEEEVSAALEQLVSIRPMAEEEEAEEEIPMADEEEDSDEGGFEVVKKTATEKEWEEQEPRKDGKLGKSLFML